MKICAEKNRKKNKRENIEVGKKNTEKNLFFQGPYNLTEEKDNKQIITCLIVISALKNIKHS